jgi:hypothetical protein
VKPDYFTAGGLWIERRRNKEGPPVTYTVWKPNTSRIFTDLKKAIKFAAYPASTPTGQALREWFKSFNVVIPEQKEPEPNDQTKMIT